MNLNMYSFFDAAASAFTIPFFLHNDGLAIRAFQDNVNSKEQNNISLHPDQFTLFKIAKWDDKKAIIEPLETPLSIALGVELINDNQPIYSNTDLNDLSEKMVDLQQRFKAETTARKEFQARQLEIQGVDS